MDMRTVFRRFLGTAAFSLAAMLALAAAFNWLLDPYGMFASPRIAGINAVKPAAADRIRFTKPYFAERLRPRTVISGNSRPELGLDPSSPCWLQAQRPVFNAAVPGASVALQIANAEHAAAGGDLERILLGLDLLDFLVHPDADPTHVYIGPFNQVNLRVLGNGLPNPAYAGRKFQDRLQALFSLSTLSDSVMTLLQQQAKQAPTRRADGFNPARDYLLIIRTEGQAVLFQQKNRELVQRLARSSATIYQRGLAWSATFETLDRFLERAKARGIQVVLFINPYHLDYLTAMRETGHWSDLENWKRTLLRLADRHSVALWDFNVISPDTTEPPPLPGDRRSMLRWFWEPAHYRAAYGERMLAGLLGRDCASNPMQGGGAVGVRLQASTLDGQLARLRRDLDAYLRSHPAALQRIRKP